MTDFIKAIIDLYTTIEAVMFRSYESDRNSKMVASQDYSFFIVKGTNKTLKLRITNEYAECFNLTGYTLELHVMKGKENDTVVIIKSTTNPLQGKITRAAKGEAEFYFVVNDTKNLDVIPEYWYEILAKKNNEYFSLVPISMFEIKQNVRAIT